MPLIKLTETDLQSTINDLRVAADTYDRNAATLREEPRHERLADQFTRQAADARRRADLLDQ